MHAAAVAPEVPALSTSRANPPRSLVGLHEAARHAVLFTGHELRGSTVVDSDLDEAPPIAGEPRRLLRILIELLFDAAYAVNDGDPPHARVELRVARDGDRVRATVRTSGAAPAREHPGVGLALAHELIATMGGVLERTGAHFTVAFPIAAP